MQDAYLLHDRSGIVQPGVEAETLAWTNTSDGSRRVHVVLDNYQIEWAGDFVLDLRLD